MPINDVVPRPQALADSDRVVKSLQSIAQWVENVNQPLTEQAEAAINDILGTYAKKSKITVVALAHYHLKKIIDWLEQADRAEERLKAIVDDDCIPLSADELRKTIELHHKRVKDAMDMIERLVAKLPGLPTAVHEEDERTLQRLTQGTEPVFETTAKRESARRFLERLAMSGGDEPELAAVIPPTEVI